MPDFLDVSNNRTPTSEKQEQEQQQLGSKGAEHLQAAAPFRGNSLREQLTVPTFLLQLRRLRLRRSRPALARTSGRRTSGDQRPLWLYSKPNSLVSSNLPRSSSERSLGTTCTMPQLLPSEDEESAAASRDGDSSGRLMRSRSDGDGGMAS